MNTLNAMASPTFFLSSRITRILHAIFGLRHCAVLAALLAVYEKSWADVVVHRAVEPARLSLDIHLSGQSLSLSLLIQSSSVRYVALNADGQDLLAQLKKIQHFARPARSAGCRQTLSQFDEVSEIGEQNSGQSIKGEQVYDCQRPGQLNVMNIELFRRLPGLKEVVVRITTDHWQSKQHLRPGQSVLAISLGRHQ
ncbi:MAG: ZrgA family zinc uptake protein [Endozoicomonas sp.]